MAAILIPLRALLGRIGGWLLAAAGVLAFLKYRDARARSEAKAEANADIERANIRRREEMAAVPRPGEAEVTKSLREGRF